jgi:hypothetical protein
MSPMLELRLCAPLRIGGYSRLRRTRCAEKIALANSS